MAFELKNKPVKVKVEKKESKKIYINTLSPNFYLSGKVIEKHTKHNFCAPL